MPIYIYICIHLYIYIYHMDTHVSSRISHAWIIAALFRGALHIEILAALNKALNIAIVMEPGHIPAKYTHNIMTFSFGTWNGDSFVSLLTMGLYLLRVTTSFK